MVIERNIARKIMLVLALGLKILLLCHADATALNGRERRAAANIRYVTASVKATVTLSCDTPHHNFDLIEWRRNDSTLPVYLKFQNYMPEISPPYFKRVNLANGKNLQIRGVTLEDQSIYFCKTMIYTTSSTAVETGSKIRLTVKEAPSCKGTLPKAITGVVNSSIVLPCEAIGSPRPTITWSKNNGKLPIKRYSKLSSGGLRIKNLKDSDSGNYQITLKSDAGQFAHVIDLIVRTSASVIPGNYIDAKEGIDTIVPCGKGKILAGASISWTHRGSDVTKKSRFTFSTKTGALTISPSHQNDSGLYQCSVRKRQVSGAVMTLSHEMYLNVQYPPIILEYIRSIAALGNSSVVLNCVTNGNPVATVTWLNKGENITSNQRYSILHNGSLLITKLKVSDDGIYTCAPYNKLGYGQRRSTEITVLVPPRFLTNKTRLHKVRIGKRASFDCRAVGKPAPNITWYPLTAIWPNGRVIGKDGSLIITDLRATDHGKYRCAVSSLAGFLTKDFTLVVISLPQKPTNISIISLQSKAMVNWLPGYNGGSKQTFEIWYRLTSKTDYQWNQIEVNDSKKPAVNISSLLLDKYYFCIRGINMEGAGPFSDIFKVNISSTTKQENSIGIGPTLSERPLPPFKILLNITADGYFLNWDTTYAPGRPHFDYFIVETKPFNTSFAWKNVGGKIEKITREFLLSKDNIDTSRRYEFRIFSVFGKIKSKPAVPARTIYTAMPEGPIITAPHPRQKDDSDPLAAIIIGSMFAVFVFILVISLACFVRDSRKRRRQRDKEDMAAARKDNFDVIRTSDYTEADTNKFGTLTFSDTQPLYQCCSKQKRGYHSKRCPNHRLKLGTYENGREIQGLLSSDDTKHGVHMVLSQNPEICDCARRKYMSLPRRVGHVKKARKVKIYKSSSSPSVFNGSQKQSSDEVIMLPDQILNEDEFDLSDVETDIRGETETKFSEVLSNREPKFSSLRKVIMMDSYDQFCRSTSEFGSKDVVALPKKQSEHAGTDVDFYMSPNDDNDCAKSSDRTSSPTNSKSPPIRSPLKSPIDSIEEKSEEKGSTVESDLPDRGSRENVFDDPNDASSENSNSVENETTEVAPLSALAKEPKLSTPSIRLYPGDRLLNHHRSLGLGVISEVSPTSGDTHSLDSNDQHSIRSFDFKSSGIESGCVSQASTSDADSVTQVSSSLHPVSFLKYRDPEAMSDISTRSSPGPIRRSPYSSGIDESYEWDRRNYRRPYNTYSLGRRRNYMDEELTNNEDLFKQMIDFQKTLGVSLDDSLEELNINNVYKAKTPLCRDGYMSDVPLSMTPYSEREKTRRCEKLLREFKSNTLSTESLNRTKPKRSNSSLGDYVRRNGPIPPPYHRNTSTGGESIYREWLV